MDINDCWGCFKSLGIGVGEWGCREGETVVYLELKAVSAYTVELQWLEHLWDHES